MQKEKAKAALKNSHTYLGIELGSTRIKGVLIGPGFTSLATGSHEWENRLEDGYWTYALEEVWTGLQDVFRQVAQQVEQEYDVTLTKFGGMGFSAMMHGYLPFDQQGEPLVPFRTWRNTTTETAAVELTELFDFNIPQRWSIAHLYQAILDGENHVPQIHFLTTLAGYVHWKLTGERVLGVGEASGMFPIDSNTGQYHPRFLQQFNGLLQAHNLEWSLEDILPEVKTAGEPAGRLTEAGAHLLDPSGQLEAGILLCPPEGDAGTGMVATNSVRERSGNVSAGTSIFAMIVLEKELEKVHVEIDSVTTPSGKPVAMVHGNNCTSDINAWVALFIEAAEAVGMRVDRGKLFEALFQKAMEADGDVGQMVSCNYFSGEPITGFEEGRPLFVRMPDSKMSLANFMRTQLYSALATLKIGMDVLTVEENVSVDSLLGHGGFFKTESVGQQIMADALKIPVSVMETAGEGGPWGMAVLAAYAAENPGSVLLEEYLEKEVFINETERICKPDEGGVQSFAAYLKRFEALLAVEREAIRALR